MTFTADVQARIDAALVSRDSAFVAKVRAFLSMELPWVVVDHVSHAGAQWQPGAMAVLVIGDPRHTRAKPLRSSRGCDTAPTRARRERCPRSSRWSGRAHFRRPPDLTAREAIVCDASDSVSVVAGSVNATLLVSGGGAWLQIFADDQLVATYLAGYVMVGRSPRRRVPPPALDKIVVADAIDARAWDALADADREGEVMSDHLCVDASAA